MSRLGRHLAKRLRTTLGRGARAVGHVLLFPVDLAAAFLDLFIVNLLKTGVFKRDCRGPARKSGRPCGWIHKYANPWVFRIVCGDPVYHASVNQYVCHAKDRTSIFWLRGGAAFLLYTGVLVAAGWGAVRYWPRSDRQIADPEALARIIRETVGKGDAALAAGQWQEAFDRYVRALGLSIEQPEVCYKAGLAAEKLGQQDEAMRLFRSATRGPSPHLPALAKLAVNEYHRGYISVAGEYARKAYEAGSTDPDVLAIWADFCLSRGQEEESEKIATKALEAAPANPIAQLVRARLLMRKGQFADARRAYAAVPDAQAIGPLYGFYGVDLLRREGKTAEAVVALRKLAAQNPAVPWLALVLVDAEFMMGNRAEALAQVQRIEAAFPTNMSLQVDLARMLARYGDQADAMRIARRCAESPDAAVAANTVLGDIYLQRGLADLAMECAAKAMAADPSDRYALLLAGRAAAAGGDSALALRYLQKAVSLAPDDPWGRFYLARALSGMGNYGQALAEIKQARTEAAKIGDFKLVHGIILLELGKIDEARPMLLEAVPLLRDPSMALTYLGLISQRQGKAEEAKWYYEQAVAANPTQAVIAETSLSRIYCEDAKTLPLATAYGFAAYQNSRGSPFHAQAADALTIALMRAGFPQQALAPARVAATIKPENNKRFQRLGLAEASWGNKDRALAALQKALELAPGSEDAKVTQDLMESLKAAPEPKPEAPANQPPQAPQPAPAPEPAPAPTQP